MPETSAPADLFLPQQISLLFDRVMEDLHAHLMEAGFDDLRPTHVLNVLRLMDCDGTRPTVLARRAGMTPQAMSELVRSLEEGGYVRRVPDPVDRRGRVVVYADRGTAAAELATAFFADLEAGWDNLVGAARLQDLKMALAEVLNSTAASRAKKG